MAAVVVLMGLAIHFATVDPKISRLLVAMEAGMAAVATEEVWEVETEAEMVEVETVAEMVGAKLHQPQRPEAVRAAVERAAAVVR